MGQLPHDAAERFLHGGPDRSPDRWTEGETMTIREALFARTYDRQMAKTERSGLREQRMRLLAHAGGRVLEVGAGTGVNLPFYGPTVESLTLTEPSEPMLRRLRLQVVAVRPSATVLRAPAEDLPFTDGTFDVVVSTLVLCGVADQPRSLREIHRVLRPDGVLVFLEHVRSPEPRLARRQDRMNRCNRFVVGCDCNRSTLESIGSAGFDVTQVERSELPKTPSFVRPTVVGTARALAGRRLAEI